MKRMSPFWVSVAALLTTVLPINAEEISPGTTVILSGRITDPAGKPVMDVPIRAKIRLPSSTDANIAEYGLPIEGQVLPDGYYRIALKSGSYLVRIYPQEESPWLSKHIPVEIARDSTLDISLEAGASLKVRVMDPEGSPVRGASVTFWERAGSGQGHCCTGSDGRYQTKLALGTYELEIRDKRGKYTKATVAVQLSKETTQEVILERSAMGIVLYSILMVYVVGGVFLVIRFGQMPAKGIQMKWSFWPLWVAAPDGL